MKIKRFLILLLSAVTIACLSAFAVGCKEKETSVKPEITGFNDITDYAPLGKDFSVAKYLTAVDSVTGTPYKGAAVVKDGDGNEVSLFANMFYVDSLKNYTVTVSVEVDGKKLQRVVTLEVVDKSAPAVKTGTVSAGIAEKLYKLPDITIIKRIPEDITPEIRVYRQDGLKVYDYTVTERAFTPDVSGKYTLEIKATDKFGSKTVRTLSFDVLPAETLEDYSSSVALDNDKQHWEPTATKELLPEWQGRKNVIKKYLPNKSCRFASRLTTEKLEELDVEYVTVSVWADVEGELTVNCGTMIYGVIEGRKWQDITITIEQLLANSRYGSWEKFCDTHGAGKGGQYLIGFDKVCTVYIDSVTFREFVRPVADMPLEYEIGDEISFNAYANTENYEIEYSVTDPDGKAVELTKENKFTAEATGIYIVTATLIHETYKGVSAFEINVTSPYTVNIGESEAPSVGKLYTFPAAKLIDESGKTVSENYTVKAYYVTAIGSEDVLITDNKALFHKGNYTVVYSMPYDGKTYTLRREFTFEEVLGLGDGMLEDYNDPSTIDGDKQHWEVGAGATKEYVETWNGRQGVIKKTLPYGTFRFSSRLSVEDMKALKIQSITFSIWVDRDGEIPVKCGNTDYGKIEGRKWQEVTVTLDQILACERYGSWDKFCEVHGAGKAGQYLFLLSGVANCAVYTDYVSYVSAA